MQSGPAPDESHRNLIGALFIQSHERLFGVLLWFMALGPAAAVGYRLASRLPRLTEQEGYGTGARQAAEQLHALGAWISARITAALFAHLHAYGIIGTRDQGRCTTLFYWAVQATVVDRGIGRGES